MKITTMISTVALVLTAACPKSAVEGLIRDLEQNRAKWQQANIKDYDMTVLQACVCPGEPEEPVRIKVRNGVVTERTIISSGAAVPEGTAAKLTSIDKYFEYIEWALNNEAIEFHVEYESLGYPYDMDITEIDGTRYVIAISNFVDMTPP